MLRMAMTMRRTTAPVYLIAAITAVLTTSSVSGAPGESIVDLVWDTLPQVVATGVEFQVDLFAKSASQDDLGQPISQSIAAIDVVLAWNPNMVQLIEVNNDGPYNWLVSGFLADSLNDTYSDGNAKYTALAQFGSSAAATATLDGLLVTRFRFVALAEADPSSILIVPILSEFAKTKVFGADFANQNVTGFLNNAIIAISEAVDCDGDGAFDLREYQRLQACFTGEVVSQSLGSPAAYPTDAAMCCRMFDYADDGDVDAADHSFFSGLLTSPMGSQ